MSKKIPLPTGMTKEMFANQATQFLKELGIFTDYFHEELLLNLKLNNPKAKSIDYKIDTENKHIEVIFYFSRWRKILESPKRLSRRTESLVANTLPDYTVTITLETY